MEDEAEVKDFFKTLLKGFLVESLQNHWLRKLRIFYPYLRLKHLRGHLNGIQRKSSWYGDDQIDCTCPKRAGAMASVGSLGSVGDMAAS